MKFCWRAFNGLGLALMAFTSAQGQTVPTTSKSLSANEIVQRAVGRAQRVGAKSSQPGYTYTKVTLTEELDATGRVREHKEKVYEVSFRAGSSHVKLLEVNGRAPRQAQIKSQSETESD